MTNEFHGLKRNRFFSGRNLSAEDLQLEQQYFRDRLKRHNLALHGFGVVQGLEVTRKAGKIRLSAGLALDCAGNEIVVGSNMELNLPSDTNDRTTVFIGLSYLEKDTEPIPGSGSADSAPESSIIQEDFEVVFQAENSNRGHRHIKARWLACGSAHPLTIAKLRLSSGCWRIDRRYHRPVVR
jgi:hypothetical protein